MKVKNHKNITNYTMPLIVEGGPEHIWYNVVINENDKGKKKDAYIVKYASTPENHAYYVENGENFRDFVGTRTVMTFNAFYRSLETSAKSETATHGACEPIEYWGRISRGHSGDFGDIPDGVILTPKLYNRASSGSSTTFSHDIRFDHNGQEMSFTERYLRQQNLLNDLFALMSFDIDDGDPVDDGLIIHPPDQGWASTPTNNLQWMESNGVGGTTYTVTKAYDFGTTVQSDLMQRMIDHVSKAPINSKTSHTCTIESGEIGLQLPNIREYVVANITECFEKAGIPLTLEQVNWLNTSTTRDPERLNGFLMNNNCSAESLAFGNTAINVLKSPSPYELDLFFVQLRLNQSKKITFTELWENFEEFKDTHFDPATGKDPFSNYCAINLSHALLKSGVTMTSYNGVNCYGCQHVDNNSQHAIRAQELANWLKKGNIDGVGNVVTLNGETFKDYISGKKGIVFFKDYWQRSSDSGTNRTGDHIDLWDGNELASSSFFFTWFRLTFPEITESIANASSLYKSKEVLFWEIQ